MKTGFFGEFMMRFQYDNLVRPLGNLLLGLDLHFFKRTGQVTSLLFAIATQFALWRLYKKKKSE